MSKHPLPLTTYVTLAHYSFPNAAENGWGSSGDPDDCEEHAYEGWREWAIENRPARTFLLEFDPDSNALVHAQEVTSDFAERWNDELEADGAGQKSAYDLARERHEDHSWAD